MNKKKKKEIKNQNIAKNFVKKMFVSLIKSLLRWFLCSFFDLKISEFEEVSEDVREESKKRIENKLNHMLNIDEIDAKTFNGCKLRGDGVMRGDMNHMETQLKILRPAGAMDIDDLPWKQIPKSIDKFIEFHCNPSSMIESSKEFIFTGTFMDQKKMAIKKMSNASKCKYEQKIYNELKHHESFLPYFFSFTQNGVHFIAMEFYSKNLEDFRSMYDLRCFLHQICRGLEFMHKIGLAHLNLNMRNIAVVEQFDDKFLFKITNFKIARRTDFEEDFKNDVLALGKILIDICKVQWIQIRMQQFLANEKNLLTDLIEQMTHVRFKDRPNVGQIKLHPFLQSPRETLHFFVEVSKLFESANHNGSGFCSELRKNAKRVISDDWFRYIDKEVCMELERINREKVPRFKQLCLSSEHITMRGDLVALVKTIRNLVSLNKLKRTRN